MRRLIESGRTHAAMVCLVQAVPSQYLQQVDTVYGRRWLCGDCLQDDDGGAHSIRAIANNSVNKHYS